MTIGRNHTPADDVRAVVQLRRREDKLRAVAANPRDALSRSALINDPDRQRLDGLVRTSASGPAGERANRAPSAGSLAIRLAWAQAADDKSTVINSQHHTTFAKRLTDDESHRLAFSRTTGAGLCSPSGTCPACGISIQRSTPSSHSCTAEK